MLKYTIRGCRLMITVTKEQFEKMKKLGLLDDSSINRNFVITGKNKKSKNKKYNVAPTRSILHFLGK